MVFTELNAVVAGGRAKRFIRYCQLFKRGRSWLLLLSLGWKIEDCGRIAVKSWSFDYVLQWSGRDSKHEEFFFLLLPQITFSSKNIFFLLCEHRMSRILTHFQPIIHMYLFEHLSIIKSEEAIAFIVNISAWHCCLKFINPEDICGQKVLQSKCRKYGLFIVINSTIICKNSYRWFIPYITEMCLCLKLNLYYFCCMVETAEPLFCWTICSGMLYCIFLHLIFLFSHIYNLNCAGRGFVCMIIIWMRFVQFIICNIYATI